MSFNNLGLSYLSPKIELFLSQIVGCAFSKNFDLFTGGNDLKIAFCHIDLCHVEHSMTLQPEI